MFECTAEPIPLCTFSFVITNLDEVARLGEGTPGDVEPAIAGEELVGEFVSLEEIYEALELLKVLWADVGSLAEQVLRVADTTHEGIDTRVAKAGVDEDGTDHFSGRFQEHQTAIGHVGHMLHSRLVLCILAHVDEFFQCEVFTESCVFHSRCA